MNPELTFFKLPRKHKIQAKAWVEVLNVKTILGQTWIQQLFDGVICSKHFLDGKPSNNPSSVDYTPSFALDGFDVEPPKVNTDIISYHIISYHIISYHIISYHIISYHIISYHIISYHIIISLF
jgi:hypothetical protein